MKKNISRILTSVMMMVALLTPLALPVTDVNAVKLYETCTSSAGDKSKVCDAQNDQVAPLIKSVVNILLYALGTIAVIMIIVGGIRYSTSNGESSAITGAKNTILYAVVGLVVAMLAWAIVNFVVGMF